MRHALVGLVLLCLIGVLALAYLNRPQSTNGPSNITATPTSGSAPLLVTFNPAFMDLAASWIDFGDGTELEKATCRLWKPETDGCIEMEKIQHEYTRPGIYQAQYKHEGVEPGTWSQVWGVVTVSVE